MEEENEKKTEEKLEDTTVAVSIPIKLSAVIAVFSLILVLIIIIVLLYNKNQNLKSENLKLTKEGSSYISKNLDIGDDLEDDEEDYDEYDEDYDYYEEEEFFDEIKIENKREYDKNISNFSETQIKDLMNEYIELYIMYFYGSKDKVIMKLGLDSAKGISKYHFDNDEVRIYDHDAVTSDGSPAFNEYILTNIKFDDYKDAMLNYMTEDCFTEEFCKEAKMKDGMLYVDTSEVSSEYTYKLVNVRHLEDNVYLADVEISVKSPFDEEDVDKYMDQYIFEIVNCNGKPFVEFEDDIENCYYYMDKYSKFYIEEDYEDDYTDDYDIDDEDY